MRRSDKQAEASHSVSPFLTDQQAAGWHDNPILLLLLTGLLSQPPVFWELRGGRSPNGSGKRCCSVVWTGIPPSGTIRAKRSCHFGHLCYKALPEKADDLQILQKLGMKRSCCSLLIVFFKRRCDLCPAM